MSRKAASICTTISLFRGTTGRRLKSVNPRMKLLLALAFACLSIATLTMTMPSSAQIGSVAPGGVNTGQNRLGGIRAALPPGNTGLHFHGNPTDDTGCTGNGSADIAACGGPFLKSSATLGTGAAGHWDVANPALDGTADRNIYDPNWIWNLGLGNTATLRGNMVVNWWGSCGACGPAGLDAEWDISLWADGVKVETWHVVATPPTPNVPALLTATVNIATNRTALTKFVLQIDPYFIDTQANSHIYYDSTTPCPGATGSAPCDSTVVMPVVDPLASPSPTPTATATVTPTPTPVGVGQPRFFNYVSPFGDDAGEPSIGSNWGSETISTNNNIGGGSNNIPNGGNSHYFGGFMPYMLHVNWDDCASPAITTFSKKPLTLASSPHVFGDPILFTDNTTRPQARTFVSQLEGLTPAGSATDYTDNDGASFSPSEGSGLPSNIDHQTFGGGPYHTPAPPGAGTLYPHAIYYCSQSVADAGCSLSLDGGVTFGPAVVIYTIADCGGLHGHIKVAPDGTAYIPNKECGSGDVGVIVSEDNGITWTVKPVAPSTTDGQWDPSVGVAADGSVYLGYRDVNGRARTAVSFDKGNTWVRDQDVGAQLGIKKIAFPAVVAGDGGMTAGRAAFAFYGTATDGDDTVQAPDLFTNPDGSLAVWYLYISTTYDGGQTWQTQNVTPGDPIQRGAICNDGACRNMLDFFDATIDKRGRVLVGWDDGCIGGCVNAEPNSFTAQATITRQAGGKRMFAIYDPVEPTVAGAPKGTAVANGAGTEINVTWPVPDNGGATITSYKVYRKYGAGGTFTLLATVNEPRYTDSSFTAPTTDNFYRVTAVNSQGEGPYCHDITVGTGPTEFACIEPGITTNLDLNPDASDADSGQNTPPDGSVNVRRLQIAEPYMGAGVSKLVFNLRVAPSLLSSPPPNSQWLIIWNSLSPTADFDRRYVAMKTDGNGVPTFEYGRFGVPLDPTNPNPNANTPQPLGSADSGTYNLGTGAIRIVLSNSKAENIMAGQTLAGLNIRTYFNRPDYPGFQRSQNNASDITADGSYTLVGNASCLENQLPVAILTATPDSGNSPLLVTLNGGDSYDPDAGDTIASYIFTFGDGSPDVEQSTPSINHTYTCASSQCNYFATLKVKDNHGALSANTGLATIEVTNTATRVNYALDLNGASVVATSSHSSGGYPASSAINGDRTGNTWGSGTGGWNDGTRGAFPDTIEITLPGATGKTIDEINVVTLPNGWKTGGDPTLTTSCSGEGILNFDVEYWNGTAWVNIASVTGNDKAWRQFMLTPVTTTKIRLVINNSRNNWSRVVEFEAVGPGGQ